MSGSLEGSRVQLHLVLKDGVSVASARGHQFSDGLLNHTSMGGNAQDTVSLDDDISERTVLGLVILAHLVHFTDFLNAGEELISWAADIWLEVGKPEDLGVQVWKAVNDLLNQVVVDDVLEVNGVKLVGPWVEHGEALVLDVLVSEGGDILADEVVVGLVSLDWVDQVVWNHALLLVSQEGGHGLDAGRTVEVLALNQLVEVGDQLVSSRNSKGLKDSQEHLLQTLEVPVLVNTGVDDSGEEDLLGLVGKQVPQVVHVVDLVSVVKVVSAPLGK